MVTTQDFPGKDLINHSYERIVRFVSAHIDKVDINTILEFGPGYSTCLLAELFPKALITTVESVEKWYDYERGVLGDYKNVQFIFIQDNLYEQFVLKEFTNNHDLIFIDGIKREFCFDKSVIVKPKIVILHDAEVFQDRIEDSINVFKHTMDDSRNFYKKYNLGCRTLIASDIYNFEEWYQQDLMWGKINTYNEL